MVSPVGVGDCLTYGGEAGGNPEKPLVITLRPYSTGSQRNTNGTVAQISVYAFNNVEFIKDKLRSQIKHLKSIPSHKIKLTYKGIEIRQGKLVNDYNFDDSGTVIEYTTTDEINKRVGRSDNSIIFRVDGMVPTTKKMNTRIREVGLALAAGLVPRLASDGTGGTYFMPHPKGRFAQPLGCYKPKDEEPCAPNNPRGFQGKENSTGFRPGIYSTQCAYREVCAFLLDHSGFSGVPDTTLVRARHQSFNNPNEIILKTGSFQEYVDAKDTAGNFHHTVYSTEEIHRIGILDVRIVNMDRNDGNLMVKKRENREKPSSGEEREKQSPYQLIPIDHGLILPDRLEIIEEDIVWMSWPQSKEPWSRECKQYINKLNYEKEAQEVEKYLGVGKDELRLMKCSTLLLQIGVYFGLCLFDIGQIMYRQNLDQPSVMQDILTMSLDSALSQRGVEQNRLTRRSGSGGADDLLGLTALNLETPYRKMALKSMPEQCPSEDSASEKKSAESSDCSTAASDEWATGSTHGSEFYHIKHPVSGAPATRQAKQGGTRIFPSVRLYLPDATMSIFSRPDKRGKETVIWTADLEGVFLEYVKQGIASHISLCRARNPTKPLYGKVRLDYVWD